MDSRAQYWWEKIVQVCLPATTLFGFLLISMEMPEWGVIVSLFSQIFWLYSSYRAWHQAGQLGIFVNTIISTMIFAYGVINYWFI
ncbi:MAG TPA: hypothetical protein VJH91_03085 [Candidatus Paceibacterota bacterium]